MNAYQGKSLAYRLKKCFGVTVCDTFSGLHINAVFCIQRDYFAYSLNIKIN